MHINASTKLIGLMIAVNVYPFIYMLIYGSLGGRGAEIWLAISPILAGVFALWMVYDVQRQDAQERLVWRLLGAGLGLWTLAEMLWAFLTLVLNANASPSLADVPWVAGYLPIGAAILAHLAAQRKHLSALHVILASAVGLFFLAALFYGVLQPVVAGDTNWEAALNVLYPILDVTLAIGAFTILLTLGENRWWQPWLFIAIALIMFAYADASYAFLISIDAYYASNVGVLTVELPYNIAYMLFGVACALALARREEASESKTLSPSAIRVTP
jgi:hypothetical protein